MFVVLKHKRLGRVIELTMPAEELKAGQRRPEVRHRGAQGLAPPPASGSLLTAISGMERVHPRPHPRRPKVRPQTRRHHRRRLLGSARLVTRPALDAAATARKAFPGGTWLVDLAPTRERSAVASAAAAAMGIVEQTYRPVQQHLDHHAPRDHQPAVNARLG
ncbi:hypothetical protein [Streptomyces sp. T028]|uniref:hypothetical protein n=1 Tax=Streptomyces sp. T028 TaxID=3394379 RepID=UPI003A89CAEB